MNCPVHGELNADWTSCPFCIRERQRSSTLGGAPPAPSFDTPARSAPPSDAGVTRGAGAAYGRAAGADTTRGGGGSGGGGGWDGDRADVTRGADGWGGAGPRGYGYNDRGVGHTRIIDVPETTRRRIRAWLIEKEGPRPDQVYPVKDDVTWIGRDRRNDIFVDDDTVSSQHAKLWVDDRRVLRVLNVSTSNGTLVNGVRVEAPIELVENDEIKIGTTVLVLKRIDAPLRDGPAVSPQDATLAGPPRPNDTGGGVR